MIEHRPSATALLVALSVLREGHRHGLPQPCITLANAALAGSGSGWNVLRWLAQSRAGRGLLHGIEALILPGLATHHCRRKAWLWQRLLTMPEHALLLWLGTGLDGLGCALHAQRSDLGIIQTDHPATLALRRALPKTVLPTLALRLPEDTHQLLEHCHRTPTTLVAEGLAMYLQGPMLLRLLRRLARLPAPPALLISALEPPRHGGRGFARQHRLTDAWLVRHREPFLWRLEHGRLVRLLETHGYRVTAFWDGAGYGEYMIQAEPVKPVPLIHAPCRSNALARLG